MSFEENTCCSQFISYQSYGVRNLDHKKVCVTCGLSQNSSKVGWCYGYYCFSGRQSKGLRGSPDSVLYQFFFVERESWISPPRKLTVRFWSIISDSLYVCIR